MGPLPSTTPANPPLPALFLEMEERDKTIQSLKKNIREMYKTLSSLKAPKADVVILEKPLNHSFENLISKMLLVLFPLELRKFDLEIPPPLKKIFYKSKLAPMTKKMKEPHPPKEHHSS
ncbi:hypothetical protein FXO37_17966 [Capsicum annuum]|nr:hypothetical protein FXO37_17966 [Capsicum annuum]